MSTSTATTLGTRVVLTTDFGTAVDAVRAALAEQGFGVLTEIDVQQTLHDKIGADMEPYLILGVCNPALAHRALDVDRSIGLMLPCTVVVRSGGDNAVVVEVQDPRLMATLTGLDELAPIADEAGTRLRAVIDRLAQ
jgi:uncharacterized protein (DUF302 family)